MIVHLVDGTYELFRHFYGLRRFNKGVDRPYGAVVGVLQTVLQMIENRVKDSVSRGEGDTYLGVATDHVIESFRNRLWPDYKTGAGIEPALLAQFHPLEEALAAMGVVVWPMIELEADDALASAARIAAASRIVLRRPSICTTRVSRTHCARSLSGVQMATFWTSSSSDAICAAEASASSASSSIIGQTTTPIAASASSRGWNCASSAGSRPAPVL